MNCLSIFDGISCGRIALDRAGVEVDNYFASEIDKYAIQIAAKNYPDTKQLGSVVDFERWSIDWSSIDLVTGGFPCQSWSVAGKQQGDKDERGMLFWVMLDIMKKVLENNPKAHFLIENVKMKKEFEEYITLHTRQTLGKVNKILINSSLVSAQNRERYYWTNIENIEQPKNKELVIADVLELEVKNKRQNKIIMTKADFKVKVRKNYIDKKELCLFLREYKKISNKIIAETLNIPITKVEHWFRLDNSFSIPDAEIWEDLKRVLNITDNKFDKQITEFEIKSCSFDMAKRIYHIDGKHPTLTTLTGGGKRKTITDGTDVFKLMPIHCERLQTVPDNYTEGVSDSQRYKIIGNGWTVDVVAHIFKGLK